MGGTGAPALPAACCQRVGFCGAAAGPLTPCPQPMPILSEMTASWRCSSSRWSSTRWRPRLATCAVLAAAR